MVLMSQTLVLVQVPTQLLRTTLSAKSFQFHRDSAFLMSMSQCAECGLGLQHRQFFDVLNALAH
ncbi:hypothetical protein T10_13329 [Trichinella papuae]|uniref:Uncharacterized protein n=1 Tax=Trichinella papuae TaxID=268474 RepID=A0A0V1MNN5_9BILA|nr:hypothetical protein T10_13329 [Trichinella papuae]